MMKLISSFASLTNRRKTWMGLLGMCAAYFLLDMGWIEQVTSDTILKYATMLFGVGAVHKVSKLEKKGA